LYHCFQEKLFYYIFNCFFPGLEILYKDKYWSKYFGGNPMNKKYSILSLIIIFLLTSTACLAVTGKSDSNENSGKSEEYVEADVPSPTEQQVDTSSDTTTFKPYSGKMPKPGGLITKVTLALNTEGENFDPVDPSTEFGPNATIHAVVAVKKAPTDTKFSAKWLTTDVGDADVPDKLIDGTETTAGGSGNLDFSLSPTTTFPVGNYRLEIYINDKLDQLVEFSVVEGGPEQISDSTDPGYIVSVTLAKGVKGAAKDPVNPTSIFKPTDTVHAVVKVQGAPEGTSFTSIWLVTDIGDVAEPDTVVDSLTLQKAGDGNIDFSLEPTKPFPVGSYRVEIQIDENTVWVEDFEVK
jgi:hypothetical protein